MRNHFEDYPICGIVYNEHDQLEIWMGSELVVRITPTEIEMFGEHATVKAAATFWGEMYRLNPLARENFELRQQCYFLRSTVKALEGQLKLVKEQNDAVQDRRHRPLDEPGGRHSTNEGG